MDNSDLKKAGLKNTFPRRKILDILEHAHDRHMSAENIYRILLDSGEDVAIATIYRVLTQFEKAGLVTRHYFEGGQSVFELDSGEHHDHVVCVHCGSVEEFVDPVIEKRQQEIAKQVGYTMTDHTLNIYGLCAKCQKIKK